MKFEHLLQQSEVTLKELMRFQRVMSHPNHNSIYDIADGADELQVRRSYDELDSMASIQSSEPGNSMIYISKY